VFKQTINVQIPSKDIFRKYKQILKYPENYVVFSNRLKKSTFHQKTSSESTNRFWRNLLTPVCSQTD